MKRMRSILGEPAFNVGFIEDTLSLGKLSNRIPAITWMKLGKYSSGWFADPFILEMTNSEIILLVEEYEYKKRKGRISEIVVDRDKFKLKSVRPVLEKDTHLSFPYIIKEGNNIYVCPENYESGGVFIYRRSSDGILVDPHKIIDTSLVDTQLIKIDDFYYAFGVETISGDNNESRFLQVYRSSSITDSFVFFCSITNILAEERGAGQLFVEAGQIVRPAQSCERSYGDSLVFYSLQINENDIFEKLLDKLYPRMYGHFGLGLHTFNKLQDIVVVDGKDFRHYPFSRIINVFR